MPDEEELFDLFKLYIISRVGFCRWSFVFMLSCLGLLEILFLHSFMHFPETLLYPAGCPVNGDDQLKNELVSDIDQYGK